MPLPGPSWGSTVKVEQLGSEHSFRGKAMTRFKNILLTALLWALICTSQIYASELKDNQQPPPTLNSEKRVVENTCSGVQDSGVAGASPQTDHRPTASIGGRLGNTFNGVAKSLGGVVNGLGRSVEGTVDGLGRFLKATADGLPTSVSGTVAGFGESLKGTVGSLGELLEGTVGGLGQSVNGTTKGLGRFIEDSGEVVLEVADVAAKVAFVAAVVFLYMAAEPCNYPYGNSYHYHNHRR